jgi:RNA-binding protein
MPQMKDSRRRQLREQVHSLKPLVQVGKNGVTEELIKTIDKALEDHELIKVKFLNYKTEKNELSRTIAQRTQSTLIDLIGNTAILYRKSHEATRRTTKH